MKEEKKKEKEKTCKHCGETGHHPDACTKQDKSKVECFQCHQKGHYKYECPNKASSNYSFLIDSGATSHIVSERKGLYEYVLVKNVVLEVANGNFEKVVGRGKTIIKLEDGDLILKDVLHCPTMKVDLISVDSLNVDGIKVIFEKDYAVLERNGKRTKFKKHKGLVKVVVVEKVNSVIHSRFGHVSGFTLGKTFGKKIQHEDCDACDCKEITKQYKHIRNTKVKTSRILDRLHIDLCGPFPESIEGYTYYMVVVDDKTRYTKTVLLKDKSCAKEELIKVIEFLENQCDKNVKQVKHDGGGEFVNSLCKAYYGARGIDSIITAAEQHAQNGIAERTNRTISVIARALLIKCGLPVVFWGKAVLVATSIKNVVWNRTIKGIPEKEIFGKEIDYDKFRVFGCRAFVKDYDAKKMEIQGKEVIFIGYGDRGYQFYNPNYTHWKNKFIYSAACKFRENEFIKVDGTKQNFIYVSQPYAREEQDGGSIVAVAGGQNGGIQEVVEEEMEDNGEVIEQEEEEVLNNEQIVEEAIPESDDEEHESEELEEEYGEDFGLDDEGGEEFEEPPLRETIITENREDSEAGGDGQNISLGRQMLLLSAGELEIGKRKPKPKHIKSLAVFHEHGYNARFVPKTYKQAMTCGDKELWKIAVNNEMDSMKQHNVWKLVDRKPEYKILGTRFLFSWKREFGMITGPKARFIVQGFKQIEGVDFKKHSTYSPVVKETSLMVIMTIAAFLEYEMRKVDVKTAFLHGVLENDVYCKPPPTMNTQKVLKLNKALYGLCQSPKLFYLVVVKCLEKIGFRHTQSDYCVFVRKKGEHMEFITVHVDDFGIFVKTKKSVDEILEHMRKTFDVKDLGDLEEYLGYKIERKRKKKIISLSKPAQVEKLISKFNMEDAKSKFTPLNEKQHLTCKMDWNGEDTVVVADPKIPYQSAVGLLLYITKTRPDICVAVSILSKFNSCYTKSHWTGAKRLIRYMKHTKDYKLVIAPKNLELVGYSDSDWAEDRDSRRSRTGYCFYLGGSLVSWKSVQQKSVATSTMEAEYQALCAATLEVIWLRAFMKEIGFEITEPTKIYEDNQSCIAFANHPGYHTTAKHIDVQYHLVREKLQEKIIDIEFCPTEDMKADALTKILGRTLHEEAMRDLNVVRTTGGENEGSPMHNSGGEL